MGKTEQKVENQGLEYQENEAVHRVIADQRKQKISASYTLRAAGENVRKLQEIGLINEEQAKQMKEILTVAVTNYVGQTMGML